MLASNPARILNQNTADLGIPNRFRPKQSCSKLLRFAEPAPSRSIGLAWRRTSPRKADFTALGAVITETIGVAKTKSRK